MDESLDGISDRGMVEAILQQLELVKVSIQDIHGRLSCLDDFRRALTQLEQSHELLRCRDSGLASGSIDLFGARRRKLMGEANPKLGERSRSHTSQISWEMSSAPSMYKMLDVLEEHTAMQLQKQLRRNSTRGLEDERAVGPAEQAEPRAKTIGHQPSSFDNSPRHCVSPQLGSSSFSSVSVASPVKAQAPKTPTHSRPNLAQSNENHEVVRLCRRKSLDELQAKHNAAITAPTAITQPIGDVCSSMDVAPMAGFRTVRSNMDRTVLPPLGWFFLCFTGLLDGFDGRTWRGLAQFSLFLQLMIVCLLSFHLAVWQGTSQEVKPCVWIILYLLGTLVAAVSLRRSKISTLLGPADYPLDDYANECEFWDDWRKLSRHRLLQICGVFFVMLASRAAALVSAGHPSFGGRLDAPRFDAAMMVAFTVMALCYSAACYCTLHVTAGLELAVDSFAMRCFKTGDMEVAVLEWNVVQATLRQTSCKLSEFLGVLATSCISSVILFASQCFSMNSLNLHYTTLDVVLWLGWLFPPLLLFLYTLSSAAAVTEKVDRLAPLVNSWFFVDQDILDGSRQYLVQYILYSRAGFYTRGIRVTAFNVQKICYYLAAGSFGLLTNFWQ